MLNAKLPNPNAEDLAATAETFRQALALIETTGPDLYYTPIAVEMLRDLIQKIEVRRSWVTSATPR